MAEPEKGPFLRWLTTEDVFDLERLSRRRTFSRGDVIFYEGDPGHEVMLLRTGRLKVCARRSGREVILSIVDAGSLLGEVSAADGEPHSATVIALEPTVVDCVDAADFDDFLSAHPAVSRQLLRAGAARLRELSSRRVEFGAVNALSRVCSTLERLSERYGVALDGSVELDVPLSQQELAEWSGMSREAFVKALGQLRKLGWVTVRGRTIVLRDPQAVARRGGRADNGAR